jgi:hypothetical protein
MTHLVFKMETEFGLCKVGSEVDTFTRHNSIESLIITTAPGDSN